MKEDIKVSYEQIQKANKEIETIKLGTKGYAQVNERIKAYRKVYPTGSLTSEIQEIRDDYVRIKATATDEQDRVIATGTASEKLTGDGKKDYINISSMIENCETSAFGRCLGFAGFGVDTAIASAEDMEKAKAQNKVFEIYDKMTIRDEEAKYIVKVVIGDLMRKQGVVKESLNTLVQQKLWTTLEEMNTRQLMILENKLKTINQENDEWHELYNENTRIKDVVPINQEVVYESSWYKFGQLALQMAGTDELLRNDIINSYIDMGINLEKKQ
jgi:hypothetical protein